MYNLRQRLNHFLSCRADSSQSDFFKSKPNVMHSIYYSSAGSLPIRVRLTVAMTSHAAGLQQSTAPDPLSLIRVLEGAAPEATTSSRWATPAHAHMHWHPLLDLKGLDAAENAALRIELRRPFRSEWKEWTKTSMHRWRSAEEALRQGCLGLGCC